MAETTEDTTEQNPIDALAEEFAALCRQGRNPSIDEYAARHPQYASEIRDLFPPVAMMEELKRRRKISNNPSSSNNSNLEQFGEFKILGELSRDETGILFEARQDKLDRTVALKILHKHVQFDPNGLLRFKRTAQSAAQLHHTHILPILATGEFDGQHYLVMGHVDGRPLREVLEACRQSGASNPTAPAPRNGAERDYWHWTAQIGVQIADALEYAHKQGVLHGNVKPAEVTLDAHGNAWVSGFGVAKIPESIQREPDLRSDVYGLGLILYEMLAFRPPPANPAEPIARPSKINPRIPLDLESIFLKAADPNPDRRYQSADDLATDLRRFLQDQPVRARHMWFRERFVRWCRRNHALAALTLIAIASLLLAAVLGWVGYAKAGQVLAQESQRRNLADVEIHMLKNDARNARQAIDEIYEQIVPIDELSPRPLSPENTAILQRVLAVYEGPGVNGYQRAKAEGRAGEIRLRLGLDGAAESFERALQSADKLLEVYPGQPVYMSLAGQLHSQFANMNQRQAPEKAEQHYRDALALQETVLRSSPNDDRYQIELARTSTQYAGMLFNRQQYAESRKLLERSLPNIERLAKSNRNLRPLLGMQYRALADTLTRLGEPEAAEELLRKGKEFAPAWRPTPPGPPPQ